MAPVLDRISCPADLRSLDADELASLATEIRDLLVDSVSKLRTGHLGPNLGAVELTIALHRVFDSPSEPIIWDVGHQAYVHKILTGRAGDMHTLRQRGGLSGYPSRAESKHDWVENSHASTSLSYADGMAKAFEVRGDPRPVVAVVGDGALTGGMVWEALNNIAASDRPVIVVVNDNGRSYSPTIGGIADRLSGLRLRPGYEQLLGRVKRTLSQTPVVGPPIYDALHGMKRGIKDMVAPQGLFEDLGLKYLGPVDGHDIAALEHAFTLARGFGGPVVVHAVTRKGFGYAPAENDEADQLHQWKPLDPQTGRVVPKAGKTWTGVFSEQIVSLGEQRDDIVAITAAMCEPTGLGDFSRRFPKRFYDVGIAEQHALTSAAGLATGGLHPVVAIYATFLNRAFDQLLMDVALHKLPVTVVLDRAGITGDDGASHNGVWDLAILGVVPGLRIAAPRDEQSLRDELAEAVDYTTPTVVRFPKTPMGAAVPALRSVGGVDILAEDGPGEVDVLIVAVGATATDVLDAAIAVRQAGFTVRVVDPRWVQPVPEALIGLAKQASLVTTVEDGVVSGGVGSRIAIRIGESGVNIPVRHMGVPAEFPAHGSVADVKAWAGLTVPDIGRRIVEWATTLLGQQHPGHSVVAENEEASDASSGR
jgi:1-deoxy-D-xylulose-5-phosphate synthase